MKRVVQKSCKHCGKEVPRKPNVFCSQQCQLDWQYSEYIKRWKSGKERGYSGAVCAISGHIRRYLFNKYNSSCCECGWSEVNVTSRTVPLEVNHLDGDAKHCTENNLNLLCPNCHSLTPNFRNLNRGKSKRIR